MRSIKSRMEVANLYSLLMRMKKTMRIGKMKKKKTQKMMRLMKIQNQIQNPNQNQLMMKIGKRMMKIWLMLMHYHLLVFPIKM